MSKSTRVFPLTGLAAILGLSPLAVGQTRPAGAPTPGPPYYTDSPLFALNADAPWNRLRLAPRSVADTVAVVSPNAIAQPTGSSYAVALTREPIPPRVPATASSAPPTPSSPNRTVAPSRDPLADASGIAGATPAAPIGANAVSTIPRRTPAEPFDFAGFTSSRQEWREYDIAPYTSRFQPSANSEQAVRDWILSETGLDVWHGMDDAALNVFPQRVRAYHTPQVLERIEGLLGQLVNYSPGRFHCRSILWLVTEANWRQASGVGFEPANAAGSVWLVSTSDAVRLVQYLSRRDRGALLASPEFEAANGQYADIKWTNDRPPDQSTGEWEILSDLQHATVRFSPLIGSDAATIAMRVRSSVQTNDGVRDVRIGAFARDGEAAGRDASAATAVDVPPNKRLVVSLGRLPDIAQQRLFSSRRYRELVVLLDVAPDPSNVVQGSDVVLPSAGLATIPLTTRSESARPFVSIAPPPQEPTPEKRNSPKPKAEFPPEELTRPIF